MFNGKLLAIFITPRKQDAMQEVPQVRAVPGRGLEGDRYGEGQGTFSDPAKNDREVTLIEAEAIAGAGREYELAFAARDTRRNLLTEGVPLNHLVGRTFTVGSVTLRGVKLCEPCGHLEKLTVAGIKKSLIHRGGLRAQVVTEGTLRPGDAIRPG